MSEWEPIFLLNTSTEPNQKGKSSSDDILQDNTDTRLISHDVESDAIEVASLDFSNIRKRVDLADAIVSEFDMLEKFRLDEEIYQHGSCDLDSKDFVGVPVKDSFLQYPGNCQETYADMQDANGDYDICCEGNYSLSLNAAPIGIEPDPPILRNSSHYFIRCNEDCQSLNECQDDLRDVLSNAEKNARSTQYCPILSDYSSDSSVLSSKIAHGDDETYHSSTLATSLSNASCTEMSILFLPNPPLTECQSELTTETNDDCCSSFCQEEIQKEGNIYCSEDDIDIAKLKFYEESSPLFPLDTFNDKHRLPNENVFEEISLNDAKFSEDEVVMTEFILLFLDGESSATQRGAIKHNLHTGDNNKYYGEDDNFSPFTNSLVKNLKLHSFHFDQNHIDDFALCEFPPMGNVAQVVDDTQKCKYMSEINNCRRLFEYWNYRNWPIQILGGESFSKSTTKAFREGFIYQMHSSDVGKCIQDVEERIENALEESVLADKIVPFNSNMPKHKFPEDAPIVGARLQKENAPNEKPTVCNKKHPIYGHSNRQPSVTKESSLMANVCKLNKMQNWTLQKEISKRSDVVAINSIAKISWAFASIIIVSSLFLPSSAQIHLNKWAVHIPGGDEIALNVANKHGFRNLGQIGSLQGYYLFEHHKVSKRSARATNHHNHLQKDDEVHWIEQQTVSRRVKRDFLQLEMSSRKKRGGSNIQMQDELWDKMWYLNHGGLGGFDMNVVAAWNRGYSGKGVVVTILDDGIERNHTDLVTNYDSDASLDINGNDNDPMPRYDSTDENRHGTRCAGEVSAIANNTKCIVGVAYNAKIGGVRMLDGDVSDYVEAKSLSLNPQHIDIYSASWGPDDNGKVVDGPARLAKEAFIQGVLKGRGGKGSIFVWASGNGGSQYDSCNCDGYTNSIFTVSISSASEHGRKPWYLEECSSTLATTYSSGDNYGERKIVTTDLHNRCTETHTGTSASAPIAAAMIALALEANQELTWRDVQYIVLMTSNPAPLLDGDWITNGVGKKVSLKYGYGMMDALEMVKLAERWTTVPEQKICTTSPIELNMELEFRSSSQVTTKVDVSGCSGTVNEVTILEHVQAKVTLKNSRRGDIQLYLESPNGTRSMLLKKRRNDFRQGEFKDWPFTSVHFWGEHAVGTWRLIVENFGSSINTGMLVSWQLILYGVDRPPVQLRPIGSSSKTRVQMEGVHPFTTKKPDRTDAAGLWNGFSNENQDCHSECREKSGCIGPYAEHCVECKHFRHGHKGPCVQQCPIHTYIEEGVCISCPNSCLRCTIGAACTECKSSHFLLRSESSCVSKCPKGTFEDGTTCEQCNLPCTECHKSADECLSCANGMLLSKGKCLNQCGSGQYKTTGGCSPCHAKCASCFGPRDTQCLTCSSTSLLQNGACVSQCSNGFYHSRLSQTSPRCHQCDSSCATCDNDGPQSCTTCDSELTLVGSSCVVQCQPGSFTGDHGRCSPCHSRCRTCNGPRANQCILCSQLRFLHLGFCVERCPDQFYTQQVSDKKGRFRGVCQACDKSCFVCNGPGEDSCQVCAPGLQLTQSTCRQICAINEFLESGHCRACDDSCSSCFSIQSCTSCPSGHYLLKGKCLPTCPPDFVPSDTSGQCISCHMHCAHCTDAGCMECVPGFLLDVNGICTSKVNPQGDVLPTCQLGKYADPMTGACIPCAEQCAACTGPNNCQKCYGSLAWWRGVCMPCCSASLQYNQQCCTCDLRGNCSAAILFTERFAMSFAVVMSILVAVVIGLLVFAILQARARHLMCWKTCDYQPVPILYIGRDKASIVIDDDDDDADDDG